MYGTVRLFAFWVVAILDIRGHVEHERVPSFNILYVWVGESKG